MVRTAAFYRTIKQHIFYFTCLIVNKLKAYLCSKFNKKIPHKVELTALF